MLYLDYSRKPGEWIPNIHGGNENLEAIDFLKRVQRARLRDVSRHPDLRRGIDSWPGVSRPTYLGGLGFSLKWNMGWMNDTPRIHVEGPGQPQVRARLAHVQHDLRFQRELRAPALARRGRARQGVAARQDAGGRLAEVRQPPLLYGYMYAHPGKKLLFMGGEFAQWREWNHDVSLDWHLLEEPTHRGIQDLDPRPQRPLPASPALHEVDFEPAGFEWMEAATGRTACCPSSGAEAHRRPRVVVCNFTPVVRQDYRIGVPQAGTYEEALNTDDARYGGSGVANGEGMTTEKVRAHGQDQSIALTLPPLATMILKPAQATGDRLQQATGPET